MERPPALSQNDPDSNTKQAHIFKHIQSNNPTKKCPIFAASPSLRCPVATLLDSLCRTGRPPGSHGAAVLHWPCPLVFPTATLAPLRSSSPLPLLASLRHQLLAS